MGCNDAAVTFSLAPIVAFAVEVDTDSGLVAKARTRVRAPIALLRATGENELDDDFIPITCHIVQGPLVELAQEPLDPEQVQEGKDFLFNLCFRCENNAYDVVFSLRVTKWVHLLCGDAALTRLFRRMSDCLCPSGVLILGSQPKKAISQQGRRIYGERIENLGRTSRLYRGKLLCLY